MLEVVDGDGARLAVDANGRFDLETAIAYADALAPYGLRWYEEAGDPLDYELQAELGEVYPNTAGDRREPLLDAGRAQSDPLRRDAPGPGRPPVRLRPLLRTGRVSAHPRDAATSTAGRGGRCVPHGGHQISLNMAAGLGLGGNESYPGVFQPFGGFADTIPVENGYVALPDAPGIGFEQKAPLYAVMRELAA